MIFKGSLDSFSAGQISGLDGLRRFFSNSSSVSREEFDGYTQALLHRTQAYEFAARVTREQMLGYASVEVVGHMTLENLHLRRELVERADELLLRADSGVYVAKLAGRDRIEAQMS